MTSFKLPGPPYLPFLSSEAIEFYESILRPDFEVFEYGAGAATIFLAQRVKRVITVEDSRPFYTAIQETLKDLQLYAEILFFEDAGRLGGEILNNYIHAIDQYADKSFDVVISDGTDNSRGEVPAVAKSKVKPGGWLIIDDIGWDPVTRGIEKANLQSWRQVVCTGAVVGAIPEISTGPGHTQTAFFQMSNLVDDET